MDPERLADHLAGELTPDEHRAVEAELARDPRLREQLARLRAADDALARLPPAEPAAGFERRLQEALAPEVAGRLAADAGEAGPDAAGAPAEQGGTDAGDDVADGGVTGDGVAGDELARRRARRRSPSWPLAVGSVAAGLALIAVVGVTLRGLPDVVGGADEANDSAASAPEVAQDDAAGDTLAADGPGPVVVDRGRALEEEQVSAALDEPALQTLAAQGLGADDGARLAQRYASVLADDEGLRAAERTAPGGPVLEDQAEDGAMDSDETPEAERRTEEDAEEALRREEEGAPASGGLDAEARADVQRCLDTLLDGTDGSIPAYVELTTYEGEPAILYGLLTPGVDGQAYDRREAWVLERDDCQVRTFQQRDG